MEQSWFIIDSNGGRRRVGGADFFAKFDYSDGGDELWPAFRQLVLLDVQLHDVARAIETVAGTLGLSCRDVTDDPRSWAGALLLAQPVSGRVHVAQPDVPLDEGFLRHETADPVAGLLAADGAFFGHDPDIGLMHLTTFDTGAPRLAWFDSLEPGPSFARHFDDQGQCTEEDPRLFALRRLGMPETSPLLDRYAFVEHVLGELAIDGVHAGFDDLPVARALLLRVSG